MGLVVVAAKRWMPVLMSRVVQLVLLLALFVIFVEALCLRLPLAFAEGIEFASGSGESASSM
jgi:hypothetical protein